MTNYKHLIYLLSFSFLLSACGLETDDEEAEESEVREETILVHDQHPLLPLASNTSIVYYDSNLADQISANVSYNGTESAEQNSNIYTISFGIDDDNLGLMVSSTSNQISLLGMVGPMGINTNSTIGTVILNSIEFSDPIALVGNTSDGSTQATVNTNNTLANQLGYAASYEITTSSITFDETETLYGVLPGHKVELSIGITIGDAETPAVVFTAGLTFVKGIGIVHHEGEYPEFDMNSTIDSMIGLPATIWYENNAGTPNLATGSSATFTTNNGPISADSFSLYNSDELNQLDWINVREDISSGTFEVELTATENLPTELTSVQVLFEDRQYPGRWLSANVTLKEQTP